MSSFAEAITQGMIQSLDPMHAITKQMATSMVATQELELDKSRRAFIDELEKRVTDLKSSEADGRVIEAYQRLIAKHSAAA